MAKRKVGDQFTDLAGNLCTVREDGTLRVSTVNNDPSLTIQSEKDSCDINKIMAKFKATGLMTNLAKGMPLDGDFSQVVDYHSAMNHVIAAKDAFMALPATLRKRFDNDPGNLLDFLQDPQNAAEAVELGLVSSPQAHRMPLGEVNPPADEGGQSQSEQTST